MKMRHILTKSGKRVEGNRDDFFDTDDHITKVSLDGTIEKIYKRNIEEDIEDGGRTDELGKLIIFFIFLIIVFLLNIE